jgi:hypothetical protein
VIEWKWADTRFSVDSVSRFEVKSQTC